jgi:hypothetical protein
MLNRAESVLTTLKILMSTLFVQSERSSTGSSLVAAVQKGDLSPTVWTIGMAQ